MQRPFVFSACRERSNACRLTLLHRIDKIFPVNDLGRLNAGFLTYLLVIPEDHRTNVVWQTVGLAFVSEVLNAGRVKSVFKPALFDRLRNVLADTGIDLFVHHASAPAMKHTGSVLGLEKSWQLRFKSLIFQIVELDLHAGMDLLELLGGFLPDFEHFGQLLDMKNLNDSFG